MSRLYLCGALFFKMVRVTMQMLYGVWRISVLKRPIVSIFGSARVSKDPSYFKQAHYFAQKCVQHGISVLTGGGPGIMEAASCGALYSNHRRGKSIGIGVKDLKEKRNPCVEEYFELNYFFARKWLLTNYSSAFIIFPGGFGTLDELSEILTLMQTKKMVRAPIVLIGKEFWSPFIAWIKGEGLKNQVVDESDLDLFMVTDDLNEAFRIISHACIESNLPL